MNKRQEDKLSMYEALLSFNQQNNKTIETIPALQNAYLAVKAAVAAIHSTAQQYQVPTKGHAQSKADKKATLGNFGSEVAGTLYAWASIAKDRVTMEKVKIAPSILRNLRDEKLADMCRNYYDIALANQSKLAEFGITNEVLAAFKDAIDNYQVLTPSPRNAVSQRKAYRAKLAGFFKEADEIIKNRIDKLTDFLKKANPDYYVAYTSNRRIVKSASSSTGIRILVKDEKTGKAIGGATVQIEAIKFEAQTDKAGQATVKPIPLGAYTVNINAEGYQPTNTPECKTILGKTNTVEVVLAKVA